MTLQENGELSQEQIQLINNRIASDSRVFLGYHRYYEADNPAIIDATNKAKPDNRVPCAFVGKIVDTMKGYMFKPNYITYQTSGKYAEQLNELFMANNEPLKTGEIATDALTCGVGYELLRVDEEAKTIRQYRIRPETGCVVYDNTLDEKIIAFVHIVTTESDDLTMTKTYIMTIYYKDHYVEYESLNNGIWTEAGRKDHPFNAVPVSPFYINADRRPLFEKVIPIINEHDKIISSNYANENERFANAYLALLKKIDNVTKDENGKTADQRIAEIRMFDGLGQGGEVSNVNNAVGFITKPSRGNDISESADRFERLIYDLAMVINPNDDSLGVSSGIALKMKMLPMEFKAADIEAYFSKGLQRRFMLLENAKTITNYTPEQVTISFKRNIPSDLEALSVTAGNLKGILSDESIIGLFPRDIVPNIQEELDRLANTMVLQNVEQVNNDSDNDSSNDISSNDEDIEDDTN